MWMAVMGIGAVIGLAALAGIVWSLRRLHGQTKWGALVGFMILGAAGAFLALNATALTSSPAAGGEDFDPEAFDEEPLDDFGDEDWGDEGDDDWADEAEGQAAEGEGPEGEAAEPATE